MAISKNQIMKVKHIIASLFLSSFAAVGLAAGLRGQKVEQVKADAEKTWMAAFAVNLLDTESWEGGEIRNRQVHLSGTDVDAWLQLHPIGIPGVWTTSYAFTDTQTVAQLDFGFNQGEDWKPSKVVSSVNFTKASHSQLFYCELDETQWEEGKWVPQDTTVDDFKYEYGKVGSTAVYSVLEDAPKNRFITPKLVVDEAKAYNFGFRILGNWNYNLLVDRQSELDRYTSTYASNYFTFKEAGDYYVSITNEYYDDGVVSIRKDGEPVNSYIYYVTNSGSATNDYIYTFGDGVSQAEQFGAFPGTKITSVPGVEEITDNGVLHFQGAEEAKLIYKIPVEIGGNPGDFRLLLNNGTSEHKTANMLLSEGAAYWWSNEDNYHNVDAGLALDLLVKVETARNAVAAAGDIKQYSVCGIDKDTCAELYDEYAALNGTIRTTYIDCTTVYTYKQDKTEGNELVSYAAIMARLAIQGEKTPINSSYVVTKTSDLGTMVVVIIAASVVCAISGGLFFLKRKKD